MSDHFTVLLSKGLTILSNKFYNWWKTNDKKNLMSIAESAQGQIREIR